ncbi:MAG: NAD(P)-binding domain-containing protein, partial [Acidimicrobiales bacterium]
MVEIQVIGGGRMGEALVGGLLQAGGLRLDAVRIVEADPARR